jgi:hypothetical protein
MCDNIRYKAGYDYTKFDFAKITSGLKDGETIEMVTHNEGGAYGAGGCTIFNRTKG